MYKFFTVMLTLCGLLVAINVSRIVRVLGEHRSRRFANRLRIAGLLADDVQ